MKKYTSHRSGLFLMEIIIAILFFSVVSAICLQLFVKSRSISQDTRTHDMAVSETASVAAILRDGASEALDDGDTPAEDISQTEAGTPTEEGAQAESGTETDANVFSVLKTLYPDLTADGDTATIFYDRHYAPCAGDDAAYRLTIVPGQGDGDGRYTSFQLDYTDIENEEIIYSLTVDHYQPATP